MEIIYKNNAKKSNFTYFSELFKDKKTTNKFSRLFEPVSGKDFESNDMSFNGEIEGILYLCYPLTVVVEEKIKFSTLHELISEIRKTYKKIYKTPIKYGIWGHHIGDLSISSIEIKEGNIIEVGIDS